MCKIESNNNGNKTEEKDAIISNIRELISKGGLDSILLNMTNENNKGIIIKDESTVYQIVSTDKQNNNREDNLSIVEFGECEKDLRSYYNKNKKDSLLIFKMYNYEEGSLTPRIEYEVYDSKSKEQLDLSICNLNKINILVPVIIDENDINKYNSWDKYYNDICYIHTIEKGTDISLADRKNEFIRNYNLSLLGEYVSDKKKIKKNDIKNTLNINVMKCYKIAFSKKGLKGNIGNYIILSFILTVSICLVHFFKKGFSVIKGYINAINSCKNPNNNEIKERSEQQSERNDGRNAKIIKKVKNKKRKQKRKQNKINSISISLLNQCVMIKNNNEVKSNDEINKSKENKVDFPPKKVRKINKLKNNISNIKTSGENTSKGKSSFIGLNTNNKKYKTLKLDVEPPKEDITKKQTQDNNNNNNINNNINININNINDNLTITEYNDYELNDLDYKVALLIDKRNYCQYYLSLLKRKQILIFTFYTSNDYNSREIKICLLIFSFALPFTVNALFFNDSTIHKIYEENGTYNFIYQLPQIVYSVLISIVIIKILKFLSLSEKNILEFKDKNSKKETKQGLINKLISKFKLFFVLIYILLILFWYYLVCFCALYKNTQIYLLEKALISYALYLIYPFGLCLLPGIFRIPSLASKKANKECLYRLSKIIQLILLFV